MYLILHSFDQNSWMAWAPFKFPRDALGVSLVVEADCQCALCFRDRALSSRAPVHDHHGGELHRDGGAVPHARAGCPLQGLAGPPGCHHLSLPADAVLLGVSISSSRQRAPGVGLGRCFTVGKCVCFTMHMSLSLCSSIHLVQRLDFEIRKNNFMTCCSMHVCYTLWHSGHLGEFHWGEIVVCYCSGCHFPFK